MESTRAVGLREHARTRAVSGAARMTLDSLLVDRYAILRNLSDRSILVYRVTLTWFGRYLATRTDRAPGPPTLDDLDDLTVAGFLRWRDQQTTRRGRVSSASVAKDRTQLVALWNHAARKRYKTSTGEPVEFPGLPPERVVRRVPVAYTLEELRRLVAAARARRGNVGAVPAAAWWGSLFLAAFYTGERIGALLQLRWSEVDDARARILFLAETRKNRSADLSRVIPAELAAELAARRGRPSDFVWPWPNKPLSIFASLRLICRSAGVTPRGFHAIRKASASMVFAAGGDPTAHLGHSDPTIFREHYADPRLTETRSAVDLLPTIDTPPPTGAAVDLSRWLDAAVTNPTRSRKTRRPRSCHRRPQ